MTPFDFVWDHVGTERSCHLTTGESGTGHNRLGWVQGKAYGHTVEGTMTLTLDSDVGLIEPERFVAIFVAMGYGSDTPVTLYTELTAQTGAPHHIQLADLIRMGHVNQKAQGACGA